MMWHNEERVLDADQWRIEAQAIIDDVKAHVKDIRISEELQSTNSSIHLNLTTLENLKFCVHVSSEGFKITGNQHDTFTNTENEIYETPYGLLNSISPMYRESFGNSLMSKLNKLSQSQ
ncbi:GSK3-beta interaction protein isoform X2 [Fopius arisanus]|uniref:GSK3-beta interaction protein isoform X2 n=1 Tax=Fopius arisanus TaxID=64838 RepID=A0A9R1TAB4_9HYME|nr:PREDICTED: GSK3-beta interaction protein isoform X2 [Fopius arisanus]